MISRRKAGEVLGDFLTDGSKELWYSEILKRKERHEAAMEEKNSSYGNSRVKAEG